MARLSSMVRATARMAALTAAIAVAPIGAGAAEESEIDAFSVARGQGAMVQTGETGLHFVGTLRGTLFVQGEEGPVRAGVLVCSASLGINAADRTQTGSGHCALAGDEGGEVFGEWTCQGLFLTGCSGPFKVTGGTGRFKGASGEGPITFRSSVGKIVTGPREASGAVDLEGIVFWRKLKFSTP